MRRLVKCACEVDRSWLRVGQALRATVRQRVHAGQAYHVLTLRGAAKCIKLNRGRLEHGESKSYVHINVLNMKK